METTTLVRGAQLPVWTPSRLNARYVPALRLAELILRGGSVEHSIGAVRVHGFLFDMPKIFEDFVTTAITEEFVAASTDDPRSAIGGSFVKLQAHHHLDEARTVLMKPDLVWYSAARQPLAVVDAKYKAEKPTGFPGADLYQLLTYCTVLGLAEGHLVYAKGETTETSHAISGAEIRIHQHALDLEQPPNEILAQLATIAHDCITGIALRSEAAH